uniref:NADH dehydrogenase subunit 6 n=1 Tax=Knipowitschia caucasica TaxID=637954 RepID=A0AAV2M0E3_KNICA
MGVGVWGIWWGWGGVLGGGKREKREVEVVGVFLGGWWVGGGVGKLWGDWVLLGFGELFWGWVWGGGRFCGFVGLVCLLEGGGKNCGVLRSMRYVLDGEEVGGGFWYVELGGLVVEDFWLGLFFGILVWCVVFGLFVWFVGLGVVCGGC